MAELGPLQDNIRRLIVDKQLDANDVRTLVPLLAQQVSPQDQASVDDLYMRLSSGEIAVTDAKSSIDIKEALANSRPSVRKPESSVDTSAIATTDLTRSFIGTMTVREKVEVTNRLLNWSPHNWITGNSDEEAIISMVDSMTSPQLSLWLTELHKTSNVEELDSDFDGIQHAQLEQRLSARLPELAPVAAAILLNVYFGNSDKALTQLGKVYTKSPSKAGMILASYLGLGFNLPRPKNKGSIFISMPGFTHVSGPGGSYTKSGSATVLTTGGS